MVSLNSPAWLARFGFSRPQTYSPLESKKMRTLIFSRRLLTGGFGNLPYPRSMSNLQDFIDRRFKPLTFWSPEAILGDAVKEKLVPNLEVGERVVVDALRENLDLVRISDGRYALAAGILRHGTLSARCEEILEAMGGSGRIQDICLFVPENGRVVGNLLHGDAKRFRRVGRGHYALKKVTRGYRPQARRNRSALTDAETLDKLELRDQVTLVLLSLGRPATMFEIAEELKRLDLTPMSDKKLLSALEAVELGEQGEDGRWSLGQRYNDLLSHGERLELALACFGRPALSRELAKWLGERGWPADARVVKDAFENSKRVERLATGIYGVPEFVRTEYKWNRTAVLERLAEQPAGDTLHRLATDLRLAPELVEVVLRTDSWVERKGGMYTLAADADARDASASSEAKAA